MSSSSRTSWVEFLFGRATLRVRGVLEIFSRLIFLGLASWLFHLGQYNALARPKEKLTLAALARLAISRSSSMLSVSTSRSSSGGGVGVRGMRSMDLSVSAICQLTALLCTACWMYQESGSGTPLWRVVREFLVLGTSASMSLREWLQHL